MSHSEHSNSDAHHGAPQDKSCFSIFLFRIWQIILIIVIVVLVYVAIGFVVELIKLNWGVDFFHRHS